MKINLNVIKARKTWGEMNPTSRIHGIGKQGMKPKFSKRDRQDWKRSNDW